MAYMNGKQVFFRGTITAKSAYEIALENGFEGTEAEWLASLKGENGDGLNYVESLSDIKDEGIYKYNNDLYTAKKTPGSDVIVVQKLVEQNQIDYLQRQINANTLKGIKSGEVVSLTDISPIPHELDIKVSGVDDLSNVEVCQYCKNLYNYDTDVISTINSKHENGVFTQIIADTRDYFNLVIQTYLDNTLVQKLRDATVTGPTVASVTFIKTGEFDRLRLGHNGASKNCMCLIDVSDLINGETYTIQLNITNITQGSYSWQDIQIEHNSTATEYEAYKEPVTYSPNEDGTVNNIVSAGETMTLTTDTTGAVIDVKYNRDINKAFAELQQAILSTGGAI